jgi:uncharacterized protein (TIRG00374 family)
MRWRVLLNSQGHIKPAVIFWANMAGYLGNSILPARAGELVRAGYVSRRENFPIFFVLATGITERLVDLAALVVIGATSLFFAQTFPSSIQEALQKFAMLAALGVTFIFLLPFFQGLVRRILMDLPLLSQELKAKVLQMIDHFVEGIKAIAHAERGVQFLLFTIFIWLMDGIGTSILAASLHGNLSLAQSFIFIAALGLSSAIPSTPGYLGIYQFVAVLVLVPFGFTREGALAMIILAQASNLLLVSLWGAIGLWIETHHIMR